MSAVRKTFHMARDGSVLIWPADFERITRRGHMVADRLTADAHVAICQHAAGLRFDLELRASDYQDEVFRLGANLELNRSTP